MKRKIRTTRSLHMERLESRELMDASALAVAAPLTQISGVDAPDAAQYSAQMPATAGDPWMTLPDLACWPYDVPVEAVVGSTVNLKGHLNARFPEAIAPGPYTVHFMLSEDRVITATDRLLKSVNRPASWQEEPPGFLGYKWHQYWTEKVSIPSDVKPGLYSFGIIVDPFNGITEYYENNNAQPQFPQGHWHPGWIEIKPVPKPDLFAKNVDGPNTAMIGELVRIATTVSNIGSKSSGSYTVEYRLSEDPKIGRNDILLKSVQRPSMPTGWAFQAWTETVQIPEGIDLRSGERSYYIGIIVDPANAIKESNESNNIKGDPMGIRVGAIVLGIHTVTPGFGHAWISEHNTLTNSTTYYGLWPDDNKKIQDLGLSNGPRSDVRVGVDAGDGAFSRYYRLDLAKQKTLNSFLAKSATWSYGYNCAGWARDAVYLVVGELLAPVPWVGPFRPSALTEAIQELERVTDTSRAKPLRV